MIKIKNLCKRLVWFLFIVMGLLPVANILYWLLVDERSVQIVMLSSMPIDALNLSYSTRVWGCLISSVPMAFVMYIIYHLANIFDNYSNERIFCIENAKRYKKLGLALFGLALVNFLTDPVLSVVMSGQHSLGERHISLGIGAGQIYPFIFGLSIYVISFIMYEAHQLSEEQKFTI